MNIAALGRQLVRTTTSERVHVVRRHFNPETHPIEHSWGGLRTMCGRVLYLDNQAHHHGSADLVDSATADELCTACRRCVGPQQY